MTFPTGLIKKLDERVQTNALRQLTTFQNGVNFSSNDYLGFSRSEPIFRGAQELLEHKKLQHNGATGSRLLSGNHTLFSECENFIAAFHKSETALLFNSGYDANAGFFSSVPQRTDIVLYDELCHASIRDGIRMGNAKSYKFEHNDLDGLEELIRKYSAANTEIYVVTESVFSMDGDSPDLEKLAAICDVPNCHLILDEAHALGVFGNIGEGLAQNLNIHDKVFARIVTFGKGLGCHGAAILGSTQLHDYLVNFARSFIYTTGLPPHSVATILVAYRHLQTSKAEIEKLRDNILHFSREKNRLGLKQLFVRNKSAIQSAIIPGNLYVKSVEAALVAKGFNVRAILSPTVPAGQERLRICLHSFNTEKEITDLLEVLASAFANYSA